MIAAVLGFNTAASGFVLSGALRAPVAQQAIQMIDVGASCTGTCKWFDSSKGFGFIAVDGEESDIFVHQSEIYAPGFRSLADGEKVEFKVSADDRTGEHQPVHSRVHPVAVMSCAPPRAVARPPCLPRRAMRPPLHRSNYLAQCSLVAFTSSHRQVEGCRGHRPGWRVRAGRPPTGVRRWLLSVRPKASVLCMCDENAGPVPRGQCCFFPPVGRSNTAHLLCSRLPVLFESF